MPMLKRERYAEIADVMSDRFSAIVQETGELTPQQMREALAQARRDGLAVGNSGLTSDLALLRINEAYVDR